ncbi:hypothetical protein DFA_08146 [Cavenderia fasciculata]|uniref:Uncharacterized protein n=1 Tax=Cavenderia fasciculata TaxID=261658 RepID=F4Q5A3_CACFS|nr:uncharacterized protein DFA_08146 [Cavenderia fasciculata]EGG17162.1 hypothetical protein DFA_08146 [Cavenderia fasciculata]|eukprot:XP_004355646.1 hypothetical protein DFA_08146 [Cavenderia fasciculata]
MSKNTNYGWNQWTGDWKVWWGDVLGSDALKQSGYEQKKRGLTEGGNRRMEKSGSVEDVTQAGLGGSKGMLATFSASTPIVLKNPIIPDAKHPAWERNKYDDEILRKSQEEKIGSGSN